jgi:catechol 2,3-dioxygenase-like lactoylglutathione lyase family enzyme
MLESFSMNLQVKELNHVALHVADVIISRDFYSNVLKMKQLERPAFDFPGAWFQIGTHQELHLIGDRTELVVSGTRSNHFALEVENLSDWEQHLMELQATYRPPKPRPDGIAQLFVKDPDGYWIELFARS